MANELSQPATLTRAQRCGMLGRLEAAVNRAIAVGHIPPGWKVGRSRRWPCSDLQAWLDSGAPPADQREAL